MGYVTNCLRLHAIPACIKLHAEWAASRFCAHTFPARQILMRSIANAARCQTSACRFIARLRTSAVEFRHRQIFRSADIKRKKKKKKKKRTLWLKSTRHVRRAAWKYPPCGNGAEFICARTSLVFYISRRVSAHFCHRMRSRYGDTSR